MGLWGAHIGGGFYLSGAKLINEKGPILDLEDAEAKSIFLPPQLVCPRGLAGRSICDATYRRIELSGFVYTSLQAPHWSQWLHLIARHTFWVPASALPAARGHAQERWS